jgi:putative hemolysin
LDYSARFILAISDVSIPTVIFVIILMAVSAFFSMSETVFSSVNVIRLKTFIEEGKKGSKKALWISDHFDLTLSTILVGNNLANIALATLSVSIFSDIFVILIFGEIVPKSFGKTNAEDMSLSISPFLYWVIYILRPVTYVFLKIKKSIVKDNGLVTISVTGEELNTIIDTKEEVVSIDEDED